MFEPSPFLSLFINQCDQGNWLTQMRQNATSLLQSTTKRDNWLKSTKAERKMFGIGGNELRTILICGIAIISLVLLTLALTPPWRPNK